MLGLSSSRGCYRIIRGININAAATRTIKPLSVRLIAAWTKQDRVNRRYKYSMIYSCSAAGRLLILRIVNVKPLPISLFPPPTSFETLADLNFNVRFSVQRPSACDIYVRPRISPYFPDCGPAIC